MYFLGWTQKIHFRYKFKIVWAAISRSFTLARPFGLPKRLACSDVFFFFNFLLDMFCELCAKELIKHVCVGMYLMESLYAIRRIKVITSLTYTWQMVAYIELLAS